MEPGGCLPTFMEIFAHGWTREAAHENWGLLWVGFISVAMTKFPDIKGSMWEKGFIWLTSPGYSLSLWDN